MCVLASRRNLINTEAIHITNIIRETNILRNKYWCGLQDEKAEVNRFLKITPAFTPTESVRVCVPYESFMFRDVRLGNTECVRRLSGAL